MTKIVLGGCMSTVKHNKLVRDKIPQIIENANKVPVYEVLNEQEYKKMLDLKLQEELKEYLESDEVEELADLVEVVYSILAYKNVNLEEFEKIRLEKANKNGSFKDRILLKEVIGK